MIFLILLCFVSKSYEAAVVPDTSENTLLMSHNAWDALLKKYVSAAGTVNYAGLMQERIRLDNYLRELRETPSTEEWSRNEQLAYWINTYNAFTVDLILQNYPVKSIREIYGGKPWDNPFIHLGNKTYSLNAIEDLLRKKFADPRIHFAINCASRSCPKLMNAAFTSDHLDQQLNTATHDFINDPSRNKITKEKIEISSIFNWYKNDFVSSGTLIEFINKYSNTKIDSDASVDYRDYDWNLNE